MFFHKNTVPYWKCCQLKKSYATYWGRGRTAKGNLLVTGTGEDGDLGFGAGFEVKRSFTLQPLSRVGVSLARPCVSFVACGGMHTLVLAGGSVLSFGSGEFGQYLKV